jgi:coniferyl-aldehyde dehydrogenase
MAVATESSHEGPDSEEGQRLWSNPSAADPFHPLTNGFEEAKVVGNREIGTTRESSVQDLQSVLTVQKKAFLEEGTPDLKKRLDRLRRLAALLLENKDEIAHGLSEDFGHRSREVSLLYDVAVLLSAIDYTKTHLPGWMKPDIKEPPLPGASARVEFQPKGVVGVLSPWNLPYQLAFGPIIDILGAGNRALLKPSELTPVTSALMKRLVARYFDEAEFAVVTGGPDIGAAFTNLAFDHLIFTGGTAVGRHVARAAADNLTPLTLELGGKSPVIVSKTANLSMVAERIMAKKTLNAGQICLAPDYVFVPEGRENDFVAAARAAVAAMFPTLRKNPDYTSIINEKHFARLTSMIEDARAKGAEIVELNPAGEVFSEISERRIPPTLILGATDEMRALQEEIFGPLLPIVPYASLREVASYINVHPRPLALYYFGDSPDEERHVLDETTSGAVTINDCMSHAGVETLPFGGIGDSGMGAYHGHYGFLTFSHHKAIYRQADVVPTETLLRPPYNGASRGFLDAAIERYGRGMTGGVAVPARSTAR